MNGKHLIMSAVLHTLPLLLFIKIDKPKEEALVVSLVEYVETGNNDSRRTVSKNGDIKSNEYYWGIGIYSETKDNCEYVIEVYDGYPAQRAGVLAGDVICHIDDVAMIGDNLLRGNRPRTMTITIIRDNKYFDIKISREQIWY